MAGLSLRHISKVYQGGVKAVADFNLEIQDEEFIVIVGPSGCGKSTALRMIAGLEDISSGELYIGDRLVNDVEPKDRDIAMVFQNYALYPHMTVYDNMAFGLRLRRVKASEIDQRVKEAATMLHIEQLLDRKPKALSGGQRQRVALGRALVRYPKVFLLDEPLSNLDAKLRVAMRTEITKLHKKLGTTFIYVTHDQVEAMTMGTRIVVIKDGVIQQVDTPQNLYDNPVNMFVATFIGTPQMNIIDAKLQMQDDGLVCTFGSNKIAILQSRAKKLISNEYIGQDVLIGIRPEDIHDEEIFLVGNPDTVIEATIDVMEKLGNETIVYLKIDGKEDYIVARVNARTSVAVGDTVQFGIDTKHIHIFDKDTQLSIIGVPQINIIDDAVLTQEQNLEVKFLDYHCELPSEFSKRLVDKNYIGREISLGIKPQDLKFAGKDNGEILENYCKLQVEVDFVERLNKYNAVYCKLIGREGVFVATTQDNSLENGTQTLYFDKTKLQLFDLQSGDKLLANFAIEDNQLLATVVDKGNNTVKITFGTVQKSSLTFVPTVPFASVGKSGVSIFVDSYSIVVDRESIKKYPKTKLNAKVKDVDVLGNKTVLCLTVDGCKTDFVAVVDGILSYNKGEKIKIAIKPQGIKEVKI